MNNQYDNKCKITCTDNDIVNEAEVDRFEEKKFVDVFIAQIRIKLLWNGRMYVGNKSALEFTTPGPTIFEVKTGRGQ